MASTTAAEYSNWSHEELIKRVTQLESELKAQHDKLSSVLPKPTALPTETTVPATTENKKKKRKQTAFDPSRYTTRHIALKFAYLGGRYNGFEYHTGNVTPLPAIEEELWKALVKTRLIFPPSLYGEDGAPHLNGKAIFDDVEALPASVVGDWRGCDYSKCGRTDKGVSAFGQVVGLRVRSARPKEGIKRRQKKEEKKEEEVVGSSDGLVNEADGLAAIAPSESTRDGVEEVAPEAERETQPPFDPIKDELPYIGLLNRVLPPDIRILAWCPNPPSNFDARFSCKERKYRYFFTSPAFLPTPGPAGIAAGTKRREGWLHINAMQKAASYLVGTHDFRNFCKVDASKQLTSFTRRITEAKIEYVGNVGSPEFVARPDVTRTEWNKDEKRMVSVPSEAQLYSFDVKGSAFLWHQVRCMVAIVFLVGQGLEKPEIVQELLNVSQVPGKPQYEMASDQPLVLWDCMFSVDPDKGKFSGLFDDKKKGYIDRGVGGDELEWVYAADAGPGPTNLAKWNNLGIMTDLWGGWRNAKMNEVLAAQLLDMVASQGSDGVVADGADAVPLPDRSVRENQKVFDGSDNAFPRGKYVPVMQKQRMDTVEVINAKWLARKGRAPFAPSNQDGDE